MGKIDKIPASTGKTGNSAAPAEQAAAQPLDNSPITRSEAHTGTAAASWKAVVWTSRRWQATWWPGMTSRIAGSSFEQRSEA